jgi:hypothetical protein
MASSTDSWTQIGGNSVCRRHRTVAFDATDFERVAQFFDELPAPIDHLLFTGPGPYYASLVARVIAFLTCVIPKRWWMASAREYQLARPAVMTEHHRRSVLRQILILLVKRFIYLPHQRWLIESIDVFLDQRAQPRRDSPDGFTVARDIREHNTREQTLVAGRHVVQVTTACCGFDGFEWINPTKPGSFTSLSATLLPPHTSVQSNW